MRKPIRFLSLILGLLIFIGFANIVGLEGLQSLLDISIENLFALCALTFLISISVSIRWSILINSIDSDNKATVLNCYHYFLISQVLGFVLPRQATDTVGRVGLLNRYKKITIKNASFSVFLDRVLDLVILFTMLAAAIPFWFGIFTQTQAIIFSVFLIAIIFSLIFYYNKKIFASILIFANLVFRVLNYLPGVKNFNLNPEMKLNLNRKVLAQVFALSFFKFLLAVFRLFLIASALGLFIPFEVFYLGSPLGQLAYVSAITPGGIGLFEAGWYGILILSEVDKADASLFVIGQRIAIIGSIAFVFIISFLMSLKTFLKPMAKT